MENERVTASGRTLVPNRYAIHLNPADLAAFADVAPALAGELADACLSYARQRHLTLADRPQVSLVPDADVPAGETRVSTRFGRAADERPGGPAGPEDGSGSAGPGPGSEGPFVEPPDAPVPDRTMVFEVPQVRAPSARLRLVQPDGGQREVVVDGRPMTIGRGADCGLVVRDGRVSRHHARVQARSGSLILTDLGSTNGTRVNGVRIQEVALGEGDTIELGDSALIVESTPEL